MVVKNSIPAVPEGDPDSDVDEKPSVGDDFKHLEWKLFIVNKKHMFV